MTQPCPSSVEHILREAQFLCDRLDSLKWMDHGYAEVQRDYFGHVEPSHARLKALLKAPSAREMSPEDVERVARAIAPLAWRDDLPLPIRGSVVSFHEARQASIRQARAALQAIQGPSS